MRIRIITSVIFGSPPRAIHFGQVIDDLGDEEARKLLAAGIAEPAPPEPETAVLPQKTEKAVRFKEGKGGR